jgi:hypothetical protein
MYIDRNRYDSADEYNEAREAECRRQDAIEAEAERRFEADHDAGLHDIPKRGKVEIAIGQMDTIIEMIRDQDIQTPEEIIEQLEFMMEDLQK